ncbi:hypothetical protein FHR81_003880 [Actinoalloteichus hoggarensis]|uniref:Uncharacterized protein n=1 Tax=Actinoalloteichus hoggarensis TaxID=1470176 RepID=A0A221VW22_9PSEU|nr:hypothetical protein AHOG_00105 [Actinoalloteichus hoggarensis]MBB5922823.1 hypothetical protein [Actinoalloteichus hoggarensis]
MSSRRSGTTTPPARALRRPRTTSRAGLRRVPTASPRPVAGTLPAKARTISVPAAQREDIRRRAPGRRRARRSRRARARPRRHLGGTPRPSLAVFPRPSLAVFPRPNLAGPPRGRRAGLPPRARRRPRTRSDRRRAVLQAAVADAGPIRMNSSRRGARAGTRRTPRTARRPRRRPSSPSPPSSRGRRPGGWMPPIRSRGSGGVRHHGRPHHRTAMAGSRRPVVPSTVPSTRLPAGGPVRSSPRRRDRRRPLGRVGTRRTVTNRRTRIRGRARRR